MNVTLGNGKSVRLGRRSLAIKKDVGAFKLLKTDDGRIKMVPRFSVHYDRSKDLTAAPITTNWLAKCLSAIAQMYGNDTQGDCVIASILHMFGGWTGNELGTPALSSETEALSSYHTICGAGDNGCVITDVLDYAKSTGIPMNGTLHKIGGYASVDNTNQNEIQVVTEVFGPATKLGINIPGSWANAVNGNNFIWDVANDGSVGRHDVPIIDVTAQGVVVATWGFWGTMTWKALASSIVEEAWVCLAPDWYSQGNLAPNGIDAATLMADLALVQSGQIPPIGPGPAPPGPPTPPGPGQTIEIMLPAQTLTGTIVASADSITIPPWLIPILRGLCTQASHLPPPWNVLVSLICGFIPPAAKGPCGGCK